MDCYRCGKCAYNRNSPSCGTGDSRSVSGKISLKKTQKILGLVERSIVNEWSIFECMGCNKEVSLRMVSDIFYFIGCKLREIS